LGADNVVINTDTTRRNIEWETRQWKRRRIYH